MRKSPGGPSDAEASRFTALWHEFSPRVMAYALRHVDPDTAQEVLSETFLVAWRRLSDVPGDALPWLLVVARNTIANHRRSGYRRAVLHSELERLQRVAEPSRSAEVSAVERGAVLSTLAALTPTEREALLLVAWDGLTATQAATVAGCSTSAFHVRLFRARRRLQSAHPDSTTAPVHPTFETATENPG